MSQATNVRALPNHLAPLKTDALELIDQMKEDCQGSEVIGVMAVMFIPNGDYSVYASEGISRLKKIGILTEMIHDLLTQEE